MTFTLPGFTTRPKGRRGVSGIATITINAEMRVGGLQETITVTGETPVVDVQSTRRQAVIDNEVANALPASRGYGNLPMAVPAVQVNLLNSATDPTTQFFTVHGGRSNEGRVQIGGMNVGSAFNSRAAPIPAGACATTARSSRSSPSSSAVSRWIRPMSPRSGSRRSAVSRATACRASTS